MQTLINGGYSGVRCNAQSIYEISETAKYRLGERLQLQDGRVFYYAKAGATALVAGQLQQSPANMGHTTAQLDCAITTAGVAGGSTLGFTVTTTATTANLFQDGWLVTSQGTAAQGAGQCYQIKSNNAASGAAECTLTIYDKFVIAPSTSTKACVSTNIYRGVVANPTTVTGIPVGVPLVAVTAAYYCWLQTWGIAPILNYSGAIVELGVEYVADNGQAGSIEKAVDAYSTAQGSVVQVPVGWPLSLTTSGATNYAMAFLRITP